MGRMGISIILVLLSGMLILTSSVKHVRTESTVGQTPSLTNTEVHLSVPFSYQETDYWCGPAALQMVFDYYGERIPQDEIACVVRTSDPNGPNFDDMRRAGHFSNMSTSMGGELLVNITGYGLRQLGYASFEAMNTNLATVRSFLDQAKPLILAMWYDSPHTMGHFRVATGYNETHVFLHDSWDKSRWGFEYGGPDIAFNNSEFLALWSIAYNRLFYVSPWEVDFFGPTSFMRGIPFQVEFTITYPPPPVNVVSAYPASSCIASIALSDNLRLVEGENEKKSVGNGLLSAGSSSTLNWTLISDSSLASIINVTVEGTVSGSVGPLGNYAPYSYKDRIGVTAQFVFNATEEPVNHDIAITGINPCRTIVCNRTMTTINVTVANQGSVQETFPVTASYNSTSLASQIITVGNGTTVKWLMLWNTYGLDIGNYTVTVSAVVLSGETDIADNSLSCVIQVSLLGDINGDRGVDMTDISLAAQAFGASQGSPKWVGNADLDENTVINMKDLGTIAKHFGEHYP